MLVKVDTVTLAATRITIYLPLCKWWSALAEPGLGRGQEASQLRYTSSSLSEVRMSNAAHPHHRMSQHHGGIYMGDVDGWVVEERGRLHIISNTSIQMPSLRQETDFVVSSYFSSPGAVCARRSSYC